MSVLSRFDRHTDEQMTSVKLLFSPILKSFDGSAVG